VLLLCLGYLAVLAWVDHGNGTFGLLADASGLLVAALIPVSASYLVRYWRWHRLLRRGGHRIHWRTGLRSYLAGFALTATPGKAGELLRIRYFARVGVPPQRTVAVFVFERASDLLVVLALALLAAPLFPAAGMLAGIALGIVTLLFGVAACPPVLDGADALGARLPGRLLRRCMAFAIAAARELRTCLGLGAFLQSMLAGAAAWSLTAGVFVLICIQMQLDLDATPLVLLGIYPLAMLVGALSFVPGGVGTTELAIVLMLQHVGAATDAAIAAAVATRLVTLWYAILVGALAMLAEESHRFRQA